MIYPQYYSPETLHPPKHYTFDDAGSQANGADARDVTHLEPAGSNLSHVIK